MGDWIDLDSYLPTIRDATRAQPAIAWVGWLFGVVLTVLGAVPPAQWILVGMGAALLGGMCVHLVLQVRERRACARIARLPSAEPMTGGPRRPDVHLRLDVPERDDRA